MSLGPIASQTQANVDPSVEIRRERGAASEIPRTSVPYVPSAFGEQRMLKKLQSAAAGGENIVVSVSLPIGNWRGWEWEEEQRYWFCVWAGGDIPFGCVHVGYFRV